MESCPNCSAVDSWAPYSHHVRLVIGETPKDQDSWALGGFDITVRMCKQCRLLQFFDRGTH